MKRTTRIIVESGKSIFLIKRRKRTENGIKTFYVIPGGVVEENEDWETAGLREAKEELNVEVRLDSMLIEDMNVTMDKIERYYFATVVSGTPKEGSGEEYDNRSLDGYGTYHLVKVPKSELDKYEILPSNIKQLLVELYSKQ